MGSRAASGQVFDRYDFSITVEGCLPVQFAFHTLQIRDALKEVVGAERLLAVIKVSTAPVLQLSGYEAYQLGLGKPRQP